MTSTTSPESISTTPLSNADNPSHPPVISTLKHDEVTAASQIMTQTTGLSLPDWTRCLTDRMLQLHPGSVHHTITAQFSRMLEGFTPWGAGGGMEGVRWWDCGENVTGGRKDGGGGDG